MPIYHTLGQIPRKRHTVFRRPDGGLYAEELMGHEGFTGTASLLYHTHPPTTIKSARRLRETAYTADGDNALRHRHFRTARVTAGGSPTLDRTPILFNEDVAMLYVAPDEQDAHFYRNGQADEIVYVSKGAGVLESTFGDLPYREGDYLIIHRGITHRFKLDLLTGPTFFLVIEGRGHVRWPKRYQNTAGQLIEGAPYSERDIRRPANLQTIDQSGDFRILVKQYAGISELILDHHPFDVVGWDGYFYPWAFNIHDFEPIVGRVHQPPPVHQTFQGDGFVVCSFCPRPFDFDANALPAPYNHSNVDSDEVLYYASSEFMSRKGIEFGQRYAPSRWHPPRAAPWARGGQHRRKIRTNELAVTMDSFRPLRVARPALAIEDPDYHRSWIDAQHAQFNPPDVVSARAEAMSVTPPETMNASISGLLAVIRVTCATG